MVSLIDLSFAPIGYLLVTLISFLLPVYLLARTIYLLRFSPLSSVPGPWYAAISDFWLLTHVVRLQQCKVVHALFQTYGPVVRIGPNKIAFCDSNSARSVYTVHKFDKSTYYKSLKTYVPPPSSLSYFLHVLN
jgi:hypothetical protein